MKTDEIWKDIPWANDYYSVSNHGRVRSNERVITRSNNRSFHVRECILNPTTCKRDGGGLVVTIRTEKSKVRVFVRRLVAEAFLGLNRDDTSITVTHKDDDTTNCHQDNLLVIPRTKLCRINAIRFKPSDSMKVPISCKNVVSGKCIQFDSIRAAASYANISSTALRYRVNQGTVVASECFEKGV